MTLTGLRPGRRTRRLVALLAIAMLCLTIATVFAGAAFAEGDGGGGKTIITSNGTEIQTSAGMEAPQLDYNFVWWTFILTFGLLLLYYVVVLRISETEFKKVVNAHFGPKQDGE